MELDARSLRSAFGCFATGITVVTTVDGEGALYGVTANSFTSLSLDPPLVLFCLDYKSTSFGAFKTGTHFAVNVLREDQEALSVRFAQSNPDKWNGMAYETWKTGCPIFSGCIANLECDIESVFEGGDHVIVVGNVQRVIYDQGSGRPLLFYKGRYQSIAAE